MDIEKYYTIPQLADLLGISRIAVYKRVKKGQFQAIKIGRMYAIPKKSVVNILGKDLSLEDKKEIEKAVKRTVKEYGEVLKLLGKE
jgi:excisionase family DNA binding protein